MNATNLFGGKNPNGLYTPLSEDEQEVLARLAEAGQFKVVIKEWGHVEQPRVRFGDARLQIAIPMAFSKPDIPMAVPYFDLELWTHSGILLVRERLATADPGTGQPLQIVTGMHFDMVWDIQIRQMDPEVVKALKPGAKGLTSRMGNWKMTSEQRSALHNLREQEQRMREREVAVIAKAIKER